MPPSGDRGQSEEVLSRGEVFIYIPKIRIEPYIIMKNPVLKFSSLELSAEKIILWMAFVILLIFISIYNYLIAHILLTGYAVLLILLMFSYSTKMYRFHDRNFVILLVNALLIIAVLDILHAFTFKGMTLIDFYDFNVSLQFWLGARFLESMALFLLLLFKGRDINISLLRFLIFISVIFIILSILVFEIFPLSHAYITGGTYFKIWAERIILLLFFASFYLLFKQKVSFDPLMYLSIILFLSLTIAAEVIFLCFDENINLVSFAGHLIKTMSYYFLCNGVFIAGISRPVEKIIASEQLLKFDRRKMIKLINAINCGLCRIDLKTGRMRLSGRWFSNLGYQQDESSDYIDAWESLVHPDDRYALDNLRRPESDIVDYEFRIKDYAGVYEWVNLRCIVIESGFSGADMEIFGFIILISEKKRFEFELLEQKRRAEESDRLKSAFIDNLSHEIRTPLDSIMGFSRMLKEHVHDKAKIELYTGIIGSSSNQILSVVSDLIDIARIDEDQFQLNYEKVDLNQLFDEMDELYKIRLRSGNKGHIAFNVLKGRDGSCEIISDHARLRQILNNLLNNSVKFTEAGEITLSYELNPKAVTFRVSDTGIGIDEEKRDLIFERFRQGDEGVARTFGGIGLGLSIVRELVTLMGGSIGFESEPDMGAEFYFTVPRDYRGGTIL